MRDVNIRQVILNYIILSLHDLHRLIKFMFGSIHLKNYLFIIYYLPTRERAVIKLGDVDCSLLLSYYCGLFQVSSCLLVLFRCVGKLDPIEQVEERAERHMF